MKAVSSLKNRVFFACAFVAVLSIAAGTHFVTVRVSREAEAELERGLVEAAELLEEYHAARNETLTLMTWLVADLPKLKAAVATGDGPTVEPLAAEYRERLGSDIIVITDEEGEVLSALGIEEPGAAVKGVELAGSGGESTYFSDTSNGVLEIATLPILIGPEPAEVLGTLSVGFFLDDALARELKALTQSEVVLVSRGRPVASTLAVAPVELEALSGMTRGRVLLGGDDYVAVRRMLVGPDGPEAVLLRSRSERLSFLRTFRQGLFLSALFGVLLATFLSYAVARTVTRPLAAITETMREITSTGDLARKIELPGPFVDEDATLLARAFNRLTDSIARFQRESASKERLSALGRMSAVVAHEIRNPLMIIKASLRSLRRERPSAEDVREAADDIDHEVDRLNRMVGEVLDFARPIQLDRSPTDLNEVCRNAVQALAVDEDAPRFRVMLDDNVPEVVTDGERLRIALVNILTNAKDAVEERKERDGEVSQDFDIELETRRVAADHVSILIRDRGVGIASEDLQKIFEPYFTGKRTGTGLGLAITKNIIESLGGKVTARSGAPVGTEIRIDLYATAERAAMPALSAPAP